MADGADRTGGATTRERGFYHWATGERVQSVPTKHDIRTFVFALKFFQLLLKFLG